MLIKDSPGPDYEIHDSFGMKFWGNVNILNDYFTFVGGNFFLILNHSINLSF